jgi:hypothetical protein
VILPGDTEAAETPRSGKWLENFFGRFNGAKVRECFERSRIHLV